MSLAERAEKYAFIASQGECVMEQKRVGVIESEQGILKKQGIYFHSASNFAQQHLFYMLWGAEYTCVRPYKVERSSGFDAFILFYIIEGCLHFEYCGSIFDANAGEIVLLDCKKPNLYYADDPVRFSWFHFNGAASQAYCDRLYQSTGALFTKQNAVDRYFSEIQQMFHSGETDDDVFSVRIHRILSLLAMPRNRSNRLSEPIAEAKSIIEKRFRENLYIDELADTVALSRFYFSRLFREEVGVSPHDYLMDLRLGYAKLRLSETTASVEQIAEECAFCSSSNFIRAFRKCTGMTPARFRSLF